MVLRTSSEGGKNDFYVFYVNLLRMFQTHIDNSVLFVLSPSSTLALSNRRATGNDGVSCIVQW